MFLRRENRACQFLRPDNLCEVHARFGAAAKPQMCRAFPILLRASSGGVVAGMRLGECSRAEAAIRGPDISGAPETVRGLWGEMDKVTLLPPLVWIARGVLIKWEEYQAIEQRLLEGPPATDGVGFLLRSVTAFAERAGVTRPERCPDAQLAELRAWALSFEGSARASGLPRARATAAGLDASALALEERMARLTLFNKDAFAHPDVLDGLAHLLVAAPSQRGGEATVGGAAPRSPGGGAHRIDGCRRGIGLIDSTRG